MVAWEVLEVRFPLRTLPRWRPAGRWRWLASASPRTTWIFSSFAGDRTDNLKRKEIGEKAKAGVVFNTPNNAVFPRENKRGFHQLKSHLQERYCPYQDFQLPEVVPFYFSKPTQHDKTLNTAYCKVCLQWNPPFEKRQGLTEKRATIKLSNFIVLFVQLIGDLWNSAFVYILWNMISGSLLSNFKFVGQVVFFFF